VNTSLIKDYLSKIIFMMGKNIKILPFIIFLFISSSILDLLGIGLFAPFMIMVLDPSEFAGSTLYQIISKSSFINNTYDALLVTSITLVLIFFFKAIFGILINREILKFSFNEGDRLCRKLMISFQNISYEKYIQKKSSEYIFSISNLANHYSGTLILLLKVIGDILIATIILIFLAFQNLSILIMLMVLVLSSIFLYDLFFRKKMLAYGRNNNSYTKTIIQNVTEGIEALKEIRILGKEKFFYKNVESNSKNYANNSVKLNLVTQIPRYSIEFLIILFFVSLILVFIYFFKFDINQIAPTFVMFAVAAIRIAPSTNQIISNVSLMRAGIDGINILYDDVKEIENINIENKKNKEPKAEDSNKFESLEVKNLSFKYDGASEQSIQNISFRVNKGESIAFIGKSGSGKTTLMNILLGFFQPDSGEILFNGTSLKDNIYALKSKSAYLPQQVFVMDRSLEQNIVLTEEKEKIDYAKLNLSISQANLEDLLNELPDGVETFLGESGVRLSGGQRQRVALARAFYHEREVLFLDEATSSLDTETERSIVEQIKNFKGKKTIFVIAHRLSTVEHCDKIFRLDKGRVIESGKFNEVVKNQ